MTRNESDRFLFRMGDNVFSFLHLISISLVNGDDYSRPGEWGCKLWFTHELCPSWQISKKEKQGTIVWYSSREELQIDIDRMGSVHRQGASPLPID